MIRKTTPSEDRAEHERLKRALAEREWADMNDYADARGDLIAVIAARTSRTVDKG